MNKSALALAGFGFAVGIVLFIVAEPLLTPEPKATSAPRLAAMVAQAVPGGNQSSDKAISRIETQPSVPSPPPVPRDDPGIQAAKSTAAKSLKHPPFAAMAEGTPTSRAAPVNLRCTNVSVSNPNPNAYYAFVTVDLDTKKIKMVASYPDGSSTFDYDITQADDQKISAVGFDQSWERRLVLDRLSGRIAGKINGRYGWVSSDFDCQPAAKRVL
jgi:hypothetical protein